MDSVLETLAKGLFRGLMLLVVDIIFGKLCYILGWPVCKLLSLGKYPSVSETVSAARQQRQVYWVSWTGLVLLLAGIIAVVWLYR